MRKAGIYTRISMDRAKTEMGVARQEKDCRELAATLWFAVERVYTDNDRSASKRDAVRPGYDSMWEDLKAGKIDVVIAYHPDRLYRRLRFLEDVVDTVEPIAKAGRRVEIHTVSGEIDLSTASGRFSARLFAALAQYEAERTGERIARKRRELVEAGKWAGGYRPFGYDIVRETPDEGTKNARLVINEREATAIRDGATRLLNGESIGSVVRAWNSTGIATTQGNKWTRSHVRMVYMRSLLGVLSETDQRAVMDVFESNAFTGSSGRQGRYLLTGLAICGVCGGRLIGHPQQGRRYICKATGKVHLTVSARALEAAVTEACARRWIPETRKAADPGTSLVKERDQLTRRLEDLGDSDLPMATIRGQARKLQRELDAIEEQLASIKPELGSFAELYNQIIAQADRADEEFFDDPDTRAWIETLVSSVLVRAAISRQPRFDSRRVAVHWRNGVEELPATEVVRP